MTSIPEGKEITRLWKGLDISARKTLGRAVERGEPSPDPALAPLAVALARRTWRQERIMVPVFYGGMVIMICFSLLWRPWGFGRYFGLLRTGSPSR
jgi:hypothetical protein